MSGASANLLRYVHQLVEVHRIGSLSDHQLLERFAVQRDEAAFTQLVRRHGPMVLSVCRRVLGHVQDAEDAFQAVFLILARKADAIRQTEVGGYLYRVAYRVAVRARGQDAKRLLREQRVQAPPVADPAVEVARREVRQAVDEELQRLPEEPRSALVLCYLEGRTQEEAARLLGWSKSTLRRRLDQGRERLRQRLLRRGLAPMAALTASLFAEQTATAVPAALAGSTVRAAVSGTAAPAVVALVEVGSALTSVSKTKAAMVLLLTVCMLSGAGVWLGSAPLAGPQHPQGQLSPAQRNDAKSANRETAKTIEIRGRVLDPDGKPVKGARLYSLHYFVKFSSNKRGDVRYVSRGVSGADGRFRVELPRSDVPKGFRHPFLAAADGYGIDWAVLPEGSSSIELTLRLVKDHPIEGRILSTEGKPVADARVRVTMLFTAPNGRLDAFLNAWRQSQNSQIAHRETPKALYGSLDGIREPARTDKDGRFRITGVGCERVAVLQLNGPRIAGESLHVVNRAGFDPAPLNKAVRALFPPEVLHRHPNLLRLLYGPTLNIVASASRPIEGVVREAGRGKPIAGMMVSASKSTGYDESCTAITDKEGRYRLEGMPRMTEITVEAQPEAGSSWLPNGVTVPDRDGLQPLRAELTLARGVVVTGRVIDRTTGKGISCNIRFAPLADNRYFGKPGYESNNSWRCQVQTDTDGRFRLVTLAGTGVLMARAEAVEKGNGGQSLNPYKPAELDEKDRQYIKVRTDKGRSPYFYAAGGILEFPKDSHALRYLDLAPNADPVHVDLVVDCGRTLIVKIEDADGKPLMGATVAGVTASWPSMFTMPEARAIVYALDPMQPRQLIFYHIERRLAGALTVRGDEKEPPVARLARTGSVSGRALDEEGRPITGAAVQLRFEDSTADKLFRDLTRRQAPFTTDKDGRFRIDGVIPQFGFMVGFRRGRVVLVYDTRPLPHQVKAGETLDLGEFRAKPFN